MVYDRWHASWILAKHCDDYRPLNHLRIRFVTGSEIPLCKVYM